MFHTGQLTMENDHYSSTLGWDGSLKLGIKLGLGFNSATQFLSLPDSALCLAGTFILVGLIHTLST